MDNNSYLEKLKGLLKAKNKKCLFSCIRDLVSNGLQLSRFPGKDNTPTRQDVTQFIAAWFKYAGISADECRDWLIDYCVDILSSISSSSNSKIRHSTKSNIKYIFNSGVSFDCGCENNRFKASCEKSCPVYSEMSCKYKERMEREANRSYKPEPVKKLTEQEMVRPSVKDLYREQFEKAIEFIRDQKDKGVARKKIVDLLNTEGFKTKTGKEWTYPTLTSVLKSFRIV
ncbi:MAG: hypothetical protein B1H11_12395 [Desulfobacteraceae bacterium 4484_190.1]|nr:MAG: hypothetical protein B1H11_12395 [Desulfobacteraceae bacterium 4484_190.1]